MPNNQDPGMLEDLCLKSVANDPAFPCVKMYFQCVLRAAHRQPNHMAKARVHAWLATQLEPDRRLDEAAKSKYWSWNDPAFQELVQFLRAL